MAGKKTRQQKIYKRTWLNSDKGSAYIIVDCSVHDWKDTKAGTKERWVQADIEIKDCNRQIGLEFSAYTESRRKQRIKKIERMIKELESVKAFLEAHEVYEETKITVSEEPASTENKEPTVIEATAVMKPVVNIRRLLEEG